MRLIVERLDKEDGVVERIDITKNLFFFEEEGISELDENTNICENNHGEKYHLCIEGTV